MNQPSPSPDKIPVLIPKELKSLIPGYLADRRQDVERMRGFLANDDITALKNLAHMIKGSGASYGFEELSFLGGVLEAVASSEREKMKSTLERMARYLDNVEIEYI
ncbi:Hpt domain-containing protein [Nitrospina gracilis]|uniref:Hpt domain-containing protein n=1 Tax=Nitrospina gracilis TaxID=35801 RepID=UPI001F2F24E5|nr:Hpt domain-containing protein [Nitrospina gracilis]MCF8721590.1 HPt (histidine-containing phosphotransfer) domain-containing protein [Nitrospina gracilis Nb-211]